MANKTYLDELGSARSHKPKHSALRRPTPPSDTEYARGQATLALNIRITDQENKALLELCHRYGWTKTQAVREAIAALSRADG